MNDIEIIKELYRTCWKDMIAKNADGLRSIMSADYYLLHMTGVKQSAEVFLKGLLDGTFNYYSAEHETPYERVPQGHPTIVDYFYHEEVRGTENSGKRNR